MFHSWIAGTLLVLAVGIAPLRADSAEPRINVHVSPNPVAEGESINLRVSVELESVAQISPPKFSAPDFDIVGESRSIDIVTVMANGKFVPKRKNSYSFILVPKKQGMLTISGITVDVDGKPHEAEDVKIKVEKGSPAPPSAPGGYAATPEEPEDEALDMPDDDPALHRPGRTGRSEAFPLNSDFTVRLQLSKRKAYVGEAIIAEYYLYDFGNLTRVDIKKWPTFTGFWKEDLEIPTRFDFQDEFVGGRRVRRALLGRFALFPLKPGKIEMSKLIVNGTFVSNIHSARPNDPLATFFGLRTMKQATHANQEAAIEVVPLPETGKPANFTGAVGDFTAQLSVNRTSVKANEPLTFKFTLQGTGNFHAIEAPDFKFPDGMEMYETSTNVQANPARGVSIDLKRTVSFDLLVIPRKAGKASIPAFSWNYFDPGSGTYKTLHTQAMEIDVAPAAPGGTPVTPAVTSSPADTPKAEVREELRYLKSVGDARGLTTAGIVRIALWILAALNACLVGFLVVTNIGKIRRFLQRSDSRDRKLRLALGLLEKQLKTRQPDYEVLEDAVLGACETLLGLDARGMTSEELAKACTEKGMATEKSEKLLGMLRTCHAQRFAPQGTGSFEVFAAEARAFKQFLEANGLV